MNKHVYNHKKGFIYLRNSKIRCVKILENHMLPTSSKDMVRTVSCNKDNGEKWQQSGRRQYALRMTRKTSERSHHALPQDSTRRKREAKIAKQSTSAEEQKANRKCAEN